MGLFDIKPYKPGKNSKKSKSNNSKKFKLSLFQPIKMKPFSIAPINSIKHTNSKPGKLFEPVKMTPIKVTPMTFNFNKNNGKNKVPKPKTKNLIFGFDLPKPAKNVKGKMGMSWPQAKMKFPKMDPMGDADKDGVKNWLDCRPFDPTRQGSWKEETKHMNKNQQGYRHIRTGKKFNPKKDVMIDPNYWVKEKSKRVGQEVEEMEKRPEEKVIFSKDEIEELNKLFSLEYKDQLEKYKEENKELLEAGMSERRSIDEDIDDRSEYDHEFEFGDDFLAQESGLKKKDMIDDDDEAYEKLSSKEKAKANEGLSDY